MQCPYCEFRGTEEDLKVHIGGYGPGQGRHPETVYKILSNYKVKCPECHWKNEGAHKPCRNCGYDLPRRRWRHATAMAL